MNLQLCAKANDTYQRVRSEDLNVICKGNESFGYPKQLYEVEVSESLISRVLDEVLDEANAWQNRPLEPIYPIVFFDCIVVKVRQDKRIINKAVYIALGIDKSGLKDVLGLWISENEGAKFWLGNLTELKN